MITLNTIKYLQKEYSIISKTKVRGNNSRPQYRLDVELDVMLSNGDKIFIPKGFTWDLSSVPRLFWWVFAPDGDFELAYLIHDYLWKEQKENYTRKFTDDEMLKWAKVTNGTDAFWSFRNFDNYSRYYGVRGFGWLVWNDIIILK
jgi:hypothetical protein